LSVILVRDSNWAPKPFRPLCFGEFGNDTRRTVRAAGEFYIAVLPLPFSTAAQRRAARHELVAAYNPIYQVADTAPADDVVSRLDQIMMLLAHIAKQFEPQPAQPRRPIGFRPQSVPLTVQDEN
jgi:hypothetical protein